MERKELIDLLKQMQFNQPNEKSMIDESIAALTGGNNVHQVLMNLGLQLNKLAVSRKISPEGLKLYMRLIKANQPTRSEAFGLSTLSWFPK